MAGNETIRVWANGCFDIYHFGHANFLRQAKAMGDYLIAGVHGDEDIRKNKATPVMGEQERARIISAVKWVDEVQVSIPYGEVLKTLDEYRCHFCVHGDDIAKDANGCDIYAECKDMGRFRECRRTEGISTTVIIDRILLRAGGLVQPNASDMMPQAENERVKRIKSGEVPALEMPEEYYLEKINQFSTGNPTPKDDQKIVYTQGVFDLFHSGHVDFLEACKRSVDECFLVVGILSDEEARRVHGSYPITNKYERALAIISCKFVDRVEIGVPFEITSSFLDHMRAAYVYHGKLQELPSDPYVVAKQKNIFSILESGNSITTATIVQRVIDSKDMYCERNAKKPESQLSKDFYTRT